MTQSTPAPPSSTEQPGWGAPAPTAGLLDHEILVVNQRAKLVEVTNEYSIRDQAGNHVGTVRQVGQSPLRRRSVS